jgi:hypothetical protein
LPGVPHYHVTSVLNRASVEAHGLDVGRMGAAPGIAGSPGPEQDGCFVVEGEEMAGYFVRMNNTGGPVDVWEVDVQGLDLADSPEGYSFVPGSVDRARLRLVERDLPPET